MGIFMFFYPCCIRGWRKWISLGALVVAIAGIAIGSVVLVRKIRKLRGKKAAGGDYRRLEASEVMLDDWHKDQEALLSSSDNDDASR